MIKYIANHASRCTVPSRTLLYNETVDEQLFCETIGQARI